MNGDTVDIFTDWLKLLRDTFKNEYFAISAEVRNYVGSDLKVTYILYREGKHKHGMLLQFDNIGDLKNTIEFVIGEKNINNNQDASI